jgi:Tfp pilus assembly protein PilN
MGGRTYTTLNISSNSIRLLSVRGREVTKWGSMPLPPGLVKDGLILRPKVVGAVINSLFKSTGVPRKRVIASLTGLSFIHRTLTLPRMEREDLFEAIQRAARREMLVPPEELYLCGQPISNGSGEANFLVLGVPRNHIDVLVKALGEVDIRPYLIDLNPLALARVAHRKEAIIVNLEPDCFDIVLIADGMPAIMHTITPRGPGATLEENLRRLIDELLKTIEFYNNNHPQSPLSPAAPLLVTGELSADAAIGGLISAEVGHSVEPLKTTLKLPADLPAVLFATNIGLALKKLPVKTVTDGDSTYFRDINLDILAGQFGVRASWLRLPLVLLFLAVLTGLGVLFPINQLNNQADAEAARLQTELTGLNKELEQTALLADRAKQVTDATNKVISEAEAARQEYQYLIGTGGDFAYNLTLVTDALPPGAYFTSIDVGKNRINVAGGADNPFTVISYVTALEALGKFSDVRITSINDAAGTGNSTLQAPAGGVSFGVVIGK